MAERTTELHCKEKARRTMEVRQPGASWRQRHARGAEYIFWANCPSGKTQRRSRGNLRNSEEFRKKYMSPDAGYRFNLDRSARRDVPALPTHDRRLVNRRSEEPSEFLKGHPVAVFSILGDFRFAVHVAIGCISCNSSQEAMLHGAITKKLCETSMVVR